jgi:L-lactate dehydrogenase complex protein LldE
LIESLPGVELVEQADADSCCGLRRDVRDQVPDVSTGHGRDKVGHVRDAGADELVSGDVGCLMHLGGVAAATGVPIVTATLPELLERGRWSP